MPGGKNAEDKDFIWQRVGSRSESASMVDH